MEVDVASQASTELMVRDALDRFGRIDGLVNNAAIALRIKHTNAPLEELPVEEWDRVIAVNLRGTYLSCRAVVPSMKQAGYGRIVSSGMGVTCVPKAIVCAPRALARKQP